MTKLPQGMTKLMQKVRSGAWPEARALCTKAPGCLATCAPGASVSNKSTPARRQSDAADARLTRSVRYVGPRTRNKWPGGSDQQCPSFVAGEGQRGSVQGGSFSSSEDRERRRTGRAGCSGASATLAPKTTPAQKTPTSRKPGTRYSFDTRPQRRTAASAAARASGAAARALRRAGGSGRGSGAGATRSSDASSASRRGRGRRNSRSASPSASATTCASSSFRAATRLDRLRPESKVRTTGSSSSTSPARGLASFFASARNSSYVRFTVQASSRGPLTSTW
mmetsp:Transcript_1481/g.4466  ORF Transcript_1481/g.4466 Transcript_1481/m.4466 type:complete len:281 (+) Transcript_1481:390-1232(+)